MVEPVVTAVGRYLERGVEMQNILGVGRCSDFSSVPNESFFPRMRFGSEKRFNGHFNWRRPPSCLQTSHPPAG